MKVYILVAVISLLIQFIPIKNNKQYWWRTVISFIPLFLFMALRKDYGWDEGGYHDFYDGVHRAQNIFSVNSHMEVGYAVLNKIMPSYQSLIAFISFVNCWALCFFIYKYVPAKYSWLAVVLLFMIPGMTIFFMISGIRNGLAVSLLLLSTHYLVGKKRRIIPYIILGIIATSIHTSASIMFIICLVLSSNASLSFRAMIVWIVVMLIASMISLSSLAEQVIPAMDIFTDRYSEQMDEMAMIADERGFIASIAGMVLAFGILLFLYQDKKAVSLLDGDRIAKYRWALFYCFSFTLGILGGRMGQYMVYYFIAAVTSLFASWERPLFKFGYILIVFYFFGITLVNWLSNPLFSYWVYKSVLGNI